MARPVLRRAVAAGRMHEVHRGVYSPLPPDLLSAEGRIAAALLLGGDAAVLLAAVAAYENRLLKTMPAELDIATPFARRPADGIVWHRPALHDSEVWKPGHFRTTTPLRTALDCAITFTLGEMKQVLAELEFHHNIHADAVLAYRRQGHPGAARLHAAARAHTPALARTRSHLERAFLDLLIAHGLKVPIFNHPVGLTTVDGLYADEGIVVELDGVAGHSGQRRILRDHRRDLHRRSDGLTTLRYHYAQVVGEPGVVARDLQRAGIPRAQR